MALDEIKRNDDKILTTEYKLTDDQIHIITDEKVNPSVIKLNQKEISNYDEHKIEIPKQESKKFEYFGSYDPVYDTLQCNIKSKENYDLNNDKIRKKRESENKEIIKDFDSKRNSTNYSVDIIKKTEKK